MRHPYPTEPSLENHPYVQVHGLAQNPQYKNVAWGFGGIGLGFRLQGLGFRVRSLGFIVEGRTCPSKAVDSEQTIAGLQRSRGQDVDEDIWDSE